MKLSTTRQEVDKEEHIMKGSLKKPQLDLFSAVFFCICFWFLEYCLNQLEVHPNSLLPVAAVGIVLIWA